MSTPLPPAFYDRDPLDVAPALLGAIVVHRLADGTIRRGRIVETAAYRGEADLACHASRGRTARTETMYGAAGRAYVYLIYGMYDMLNAVTSAVGDPSAVLIRAIEPLEGMTRSTDGPGKLTRALGVTRALNGACLETSLLVIVPGGAPARIETSPRIGVEYAGEWASRPWRFFDPHSRFVSKSRLSKDQEGLVRQQVGLFGREHEPRRRHELERLRARDLDRLGRPLGQAPLLELDEDQAGARRHRGNESGQPRTATGDVVQHVADEDQVGVRRDGRVLGRDHGGADVR